MCNTLLWAADWLYSMMITAAGDISVPERASRFGVRCCVLITALLFQTPAASAAAPDRVLLLHSFGLDYSLWSETAKSFCTQLFKRAPKPIDLYEASVFTTRFEKSQEEAPRVGIVGGPLNPTDTLGRRAATVAARILQGEAPHKIKNAPVGFGVPAYDWRELRKWDISETFLPRNSVVEFRGESPWRQFRWQISLVAAVILTQAALILYGLIQHRKRRTAENSLAESEERTRFTAASLNVGLWHYTRASDKYWATEHCRKIFGLGLGTPFTRETLLHIVHPDERPVAVAMFTEPSDGGPSSVREFRIVLADGRIRWIRSRTHSSGYHQSVPDKVSGIFVDFTDLKAAESEAAVQRLELAHLMRVSVLGELSGAIAHELNQPLTAILSNAQAALQLLSHEPPVLDEIRDALGDIVQEDNRASEVIKRLRGLLKKGESKTESVHINDLVESTMSLLHSELITRQISVTMDLTPGLPVIVSDSIQLQQVILNIVMNAMDAMASISAGRRRVEIRTGVDKSGFVTVSIRDNGIGIKGDEKRLFEPFYTSKEQGLGLGLALCSTIVVAHGGTLTLTNHHRGGAVAVLSLPPPVEEYRVAAQ